MGGVDVGEVGAAGHDDGVAFADDFGVFGDEDCFGDFVGAGVEEDDLAGAGGGVDDVLEGGAVVGYSVPPLAAAGAGAGE